MNKEKEIEKVFDILDKHIALEHKAFTDNIVGEWDAAKAIVEAGYRKADEVRKETAKEFKETRKYIFRFILKNKGNTSIPYFEAEERVFYKIDREVDREFLQQYGIKVDE